MLEDCTTAQQRWGGVNDMIDRWLQERRALLIQYTGLMDTEGLDGRNSEHSKNVLEFCQTLVDYISTGHFEVYGQLAKEGHDFQDTEGLEIADELYQSINNTTQSALDFNDKYQTPDDLKTVTQDLSQLGEQLSSRFKAEDCMINVLHTSHSEPATAS